MPRNISFCLTKKQIRDKSKTVTRRLGWLFLKPGDILKACEQCQGIKKGELVVLCLIEVVNVSRERLGDITQDEVIKEGFPEMTPGEFVVFFIDHMRPVDGPDEIVTRIEFKYLTR